MWQYPVFILSVEEILLLVSSLQIFPIWAEGRIHNPQSFASTVVLGTSLPIYILWYTNILESLSWLCFLYHYQYEAAPGAVFYYSSLFQYINFHSDPLVMF